MYILISPAKKQDFDSVPKGLGTSKMAFPDETHQLVKLLQSKTSQSLEDLMDISSTLAELNMDRFKHFDFTWKTEHQKQAIFAFQGDVYRYLSALTLDNSAINFAQKHLGILSGLYGLLRPLDMIQPYRLEMGTRLKNNQGKDLYAFWGRKITEKLSERIIGSGSNILINLASLEYVKVIQPELLTVPMLTIDFKVEKGGALKTVGVMAKRARGMMARAICKGQLTDVEHLKLFNEAGYRFEEALSSEFNWVFVTAS